MLTHGPVALLIAAGLVVRVKLIELFRECQFKPGWQHGLVRATPGRIIQVERRHPVLDRRVMLSWFRPDAGDRKFMPLIDAHRIDIGGSTFELWGIVRADAWTDNFYPQAWRCWCVETPDKVIPTESIDAPKVCH